MKTSKQAKRTRRKQANVQQQNAIRLKERKLLRELLDDLKLTGIGKEIGLVEQLLEQRQHAPRILMPTSSQESGTAQKVLRELRRFLAQERWQPPGLRQSYTSTEYFSLVRPAVQFLTEPGKTKSNPLDASNVRDASMYAAQLAGANTIRSFDSWMASGLRDIAADFSRLNQQLYFLDIPQKSYARQSPGLVLELYQVRPERKRFQINGESRWALRCGQANSEAMGMEWVMWDLDQLGLKGPTRQLPVYVQSHVLERLYGPDGRLSELAYEEAILHDMIYLSLKNPKLHDIQGQAASYLVEYGYEGCKLGYLVCELHPEGVVVRTFLFLTMDGTPEGDALHRRLKINRFDKAVLGLDTLTQLVTSDIQSDPSIRAILRECDIDHLFDHIECSGQPVTGVAAEFHRYLRLRKPK